MSRQSRADQQASIAALPDEAVANLAATLLFLMLGGRVLEALADCIVRLREGMSVLHGRGLID